VSIPKPFSRPSVEINHTGRRWVQTKARFLSVDDIVQDKGLVVLAKKVGPLYRIEFSSGEIMLGTTDEPMRAFTLGESVGICE